MAVAVEVEAAADLATAGAEGAGALSSGTGLVIPSAAPTSPPAKLARSTNRDTRSASGSAAGCCPIPNLPNTPSLWRRPYRYQEAIDVLDTLQKRNTPRALNYRGYATRKLGRTEEGISYYLKSVALDPEYIAQVREYLGEAYVIQGKINKISRKTNWPRSRSSAARPNARNTKICPRRSPRRRTFSCVLRPHSRRKPWPTPMGPPPFAFFFGIGQRGGAWARVLAHLPGGQISRLERRKLCHLEAVNVLFRVPEIVGHLVAQPQFRRPPIRPSRAGAPCPKAGNPEAPAGAAESGCRSRA